MILWTRFEPGAAGWKALTNPRRTTSFVRVKIRETEPCRHFRNVSCWPTVDDDDDDDDDDGGEKIVNVTILWMIFFARSPVCDDPNEPLFSHRKGHTDRDALWKMCNSTLNEMDTGPIAVEGMQGFGLWE